MGAGGSRQFCPAWSSLLTTGPHHRPSTSTLFSAPIVNTQNAGTDLRVGPAHQTRTPAPLLREAGRAETLRGPQTPGPGGLSPIAAHLDRGTGAGAAPARSGPAGRAAQRRRPWGRTRGARSGAHGAGRTEPSAKAREGGTAKEQPGHRRGSAVSLPGAGPAAGASPGAEGPGSRAGIPHRGQGEAGFPAWPGAAGAGAGGARRPGADSPAPPSCRPSRLAAPRLPSGISSFPSCTHGGSGSAGLRGV